MAKHTGFGKEILLILPALFILALFYVLPYLNMTYISFLTPTKTGSYLFVFTFQNYVDNLSDPFFWKVVGKTLLMGMATTLACLVLGYPLAYHLARTTSRFKGVLFTLVISPLLVGVVIRCYGWMILLGDKGLINEALLRVGLISDKIGLMYNSFGIILALVQVFLPYIVLSLASSIQSINPELEYTARSLGASKSMTFLKVILPLSLPGVLSGSILVFVLAISSYAIPILLGGFKVLTVPLLITQTVLELFNWPLGSAMAITMFALTLFIILVYMRIMNQFMRGVR
jgi:putative spermidine/putrescine transport system permease protein